MKFFLLVCIFVILTGCQCSSSPSPFTATITTAISSSDSTAGKYILGEDIHCEVTITNRDSNKGYYLLARSTPLEGLRSAIFAIQTEKGDTVPYDGILVKRGAIIEGEFAYIGPNSSLSSSVDLSSGYGFKSAGIRYKVQLRMRLQFSEHTSFKQESTDNNFKLASQLVVSNIEEFLLSPGKQNQPWKRTNGELARLNRTQKTPHYSTAPSSLVRTPEAAISPTFKGKRTTSDETTATTAYKAAYASLTPSYRSVDGDPSLYKTWFGAAYKSYKLTVKGVYEDVKTSMGTYQYALYFHGPGCEKSDYAYTYYDSSVIYFCNSYFSAPTTGSNSKMGTVVHEMTHAVSDTDDMEYGEEDCQQLARDSPRDAIDNADNYEYFAEAQ